MDFESFKRKFQQKPVDEISNRVPIKPMVSVCVQTYEHVNFIKQCLDGILIQQANFSFEILLGEDESTDGTRKICLEYAEKYPDRIRLFLHRRENNIKVNGTPTGRFNFVYNLFTARGKYIALCEGDDYWTDPLKLQKQVDFLELNPDYSVCFHNVNILINKNKSIECFPMHLKLEKEEFKTKDLLKQWFVPTASILFAQRDSREFPEWFFNCASGDIPLLLLLSLEGKLKYFDEIMAVYRLHDGGISKIHEGYFKVFAMIYIYQNFNIYTEYEFEEQINKAMIYEVQMHLPEIRELKILKQKTKKNELKSLKIKIKEKIFRLLK